MKRFNIIILLTLFFVGMIALSSAVMLDIPIEIEEVQHKKNVTETVYEDDVMYGVVSYYGEKWNGRTTANMEIYDHKMLTCASPILPFNTIVEITNLANNKSIVIRVNDRGPFKMDMNGKALRPLQAHPIRVLDLSEESFKSIGDLDKGLLNISYRIVG
jgi:rare lipoprotein A